MRTSGSASIGIVAELVDVHATLGIGVVATEVVGDGGGRGFGGLLECHTAGDFGVSSEDGNCCGRWQVSFSRSEIKRAESELASEVLLRGSHSNAGYH